MYCSFVLPQRRSERNLNYMYLSIHKKANERERSKKHTQWIDKKKNKLQNLTAYQTGRRIFDVIFVLSLKPAKKRNDQVDKSEKGEKSRTQNKKAKMPYFLRIKKVFSHSICMHFWHENKRMQSTTHIQIERSASSSLEERDSRLGKCHTSHIRSLVAICISDCDEIWL